MMAVMTAPARSGPERKKDTLAKLESEGADVWVATSSPSGVVHMVPLSFAWDGQLLTLAVLPDSATFRNLGVSGRARLGLGPTRDVVLIDVELAGQAGVAEGPQQVAEAYAAQSGWDPRAESDAYRFLFLRPTRIQAWREANELAGKMLMRDGAWLF
jgi:hypothetical protein